MKIKLDCDFQIWLTVLDCLCPWNKSLHAAAGGGSSAAAALKLRPAQNQNNKDPIEAIDTDNIKALKKHVDEMIDKHESRIKSKGFMSVREAQLMRSLQDKANMLNEIVHEVENHQHKKKIREMKKQIQNSNLQQQQQNQHQQNIPTSFDLNNLLFHKHN